MIDKGERERGREREREGERMFTKELTLMFPMKCEIFYWLIFFKIRMKDILRFKSKVISTIKIAAEDKLPSSVNREKYLISGIE